MGYFDCFATFYDGSLEALHIESRARAAAVLDRSASLTVLGVDLSSGMLKKAAHRIERVNRVVIAELRRRFWEPLEAVAGNFHREDVSPLPKHGGQRVPTTGVK